MSATSYPLTPEIIDYLRTFSLMREDDVLAGLRQVTEPLPLSRMQISVEQGRLMALIAQMMGVRRAIEIGVFTGYSALCVAQQLPADGKLVACDISEEWTAIGRRFWEEAGVADRIDLRIGPAAETLAALIDSGEQDTYDFAFIDADKESNDIYYEQCLALLRSGGVVAIDNIFQGGQVADPNCQDAKITSIRDFTQKIAQDDRVEPSLIPISDGLLLACKR